MPSTYTPIATASPSGVNGITFSNIPATYTDLVLVGNAGYTGSSSFLVLEQINGNNSTIYSTTLLLGNGSSALTWSSNNVQTIYLAYSNPPLNSLEQTYLINFQNYSNTTTFKTVVGRYGYSSVETAAVVGLWRNTAAISSFVLRNSGGGTFMTGSSFTLYGIKAA